MKENRMHLGIRSKMSKYLQPYIDAWMLSFRKQRLEKIENIFDYQNIIRKRYAPFQTQATNGFYGIEYTLREYAGYNKQVNASIEHGIFANYLGNTYEIVDPYMPSVFTFSKQRHVYIRSITDKLIFEIGPYIHYAKNIYNEFRMKEIKRNMGKTLLVFPAHGIEDFTFKHETDIFCDYIDSFCDEHKFNTVLVCLYFVDIQNGLHLYYEKRGYTVVSAGHRDNNDFLNILRTIIDLSDYVMNENMGTQIGYALYLGKPQIVYRSILTPVIKDASIRSNTDATNFWIMVSNLFSQYSDEISEEQREFVKNAWGFDDIKSPGQMKDIFKFIHEIAYSKKYLERSKRVKKKYTDIDEFIECAIK